MHACRSAQDLEERFDATRARLEVVTAEHEALLSEAEALRAEAGQRQKKFVAVQGAFKSRESTLQVDVIRNGCVHDVDQCQRQLRGVEVDQLRHRQPSTS